MTFSQRPSKSVSGGKKYISALNVVPPPEFRPDDSDSQKGQPSVHCCTMPEALAPPLKLSDHGHMTDPVDEDGS